MKVYINLYKSIYDLGQLEVGHIHLSRRDALASLENTGTVEDKELYIKTIGLELENLL